MATAKKTDSGTWAIQVQVNGSRVLKTFPTKKLAEDWAAEQRVNKRKTTTHGVGATKTLRDALERFRDEVAPKRDGAVNEVRRLNAYLKNDKGAHPLPLDTFIGDVTTDDLQEWINHRGTLTAEGSVLRDINLMGSVLTTAVTLWKWIKVSPLKGTIKPQSPKHRERVIAGWETRRMLRRLNYNGKDFDSKQRQVAAAFLLALFTGMRAGEIVGLEWKNVHANYIDLRKTKTDPRQVVLTTAARQLLARLTAARGGAINVFDMHPHTLDALFRKYRTQLAVAEDFPGDFTFHDSRHTACTAISRDMDMQSLCKTMGWRDPKHALIYYNPKPGALADEYEARRLERHMRDKELAAMPNNVRPMRAA